MDEQEEFFSPKHKQLLNIATWAKYLAWVAIVIFTFVAFLNSFKVNMIIQISFKDRQSLVKYSKISRYCCKHYFECCKCFI